MNRDETIVAIDILIRRYNSGRFVQPCAFNCPLCSLYNRVDDSTCSQCPNKALGHCHTRADNYNLDHYDIHDYPNLAKFWTTVKRFIEPLEEEIELADIKDAILEIAKPYKKVTDDTI
jgi:hypothetical protein